MQKQKMEISDDGWRVNEYTFIITTKLQTELKT